MSKLEQLREALLDLERARAQEELQRKTSDTLLAGLEVISRSTTREQMFLGLLGVLREPLDFEDAFLLTLRENGQLQPVVWTHERFSLEEWQPGLSFQRIMRGFPSTVFDVEQVPEWQQQPLSLRAGVCSALHIPMESQSQKAILICTHPIRGHFGKRQMQLAKRLMPLASQGLLHLELRAVVAERERLFFHSSECLAVSNLSGIFKHVNTTWSRLFGWPMEAFQERPFYEFVLPEREQEDMRRTWEELEQGRMQSVSCELLCKRRDGETFWMLWHMDAVPEDGVIYVVARDITEQTRIQRVIQLNEELERARDEAVEANEAKSRFLANMSHELRTPLNAIIGYAEILQEDAEEDGISDVVEDLEKIRKSGRHLLELIDDLLDLSKIESGKFEIAFERVSLTRLLGDVATAIRPLIERNHNQLHTDSGTDEIYITTDPLRLRQVLYNLLSNACKFTEHGSIFLEVAPPPAGESMLCISIRDTGIGMTQEQQKKIFNAFTQANIKISRKYGGTGLGLTLSRQLVRLLGGEISISSQLHVGTTFQVHVPINGNATQQPPVDEAPMAPIETTPSLGMCAPSHPNHTKK